MRKRSFSGLFISLDGVTEAPNLWQFDNFDADMGAAMGAHPRRGGYDPAGQGHLPGVGAILADLHDEPYRQPSSTTRPNMCSQPP